MEPFTTNNRMEIVAFLAVMEDIDKIAEKSTVNIYTDSAYLANTFNCGWYRNWLANGWKTSDKQPVKNQDLWGRIIALYIKNCAKHTIKIVKVAAHRDNKYNNMVDMLAVRERKRLEN